MRIVGFTGKSGAGKDTAAQCLIDKGWKKVSFADPIKEMLIALDPTVLNDDGDYWSLSCIISESSFEHAKNSVPEVRRLLQVLGTECGRDIIGKHLPNPWLEIAKAKIYEHFDNGYNVVVTDVRFDDEAAMISGLDGIVVHIIGVGCGSNEHSSESGVSDALVRATVFNQNSINVLHQRVLSVVNADF